MPRKRPPLQRLWPVRPLAALLCALALAAQEAPEPLAIVDTELLDSEDGYPIPADSVFYTGETVHAKCNIAGFAIRNFRAHLTYRVDYLGPDGSRFSLAEAGKIDVEVFPQDEDWRPILRAKAELPHHGSGGTYTIVFSVRDVLADQELRQEVPIIVEGENIEVSGDLTIRNLAFSRSEDGEKLAAPAYDAGDTIWARFHITGYQIGEDNFFDVESDLQVLSQEGDVLYSFSSQAETGSPIYPRRWLPAKFHLYLDDNIPSGEYAIQVSVHDKLAGKTFRAKRGFVVR